MDRPSFSVVVCNYNYGRFVGEAIRSALAQDYDGAFEVIVVDDGSTDDSRTVIAAIDDARLRVVEQPNRGASAAFAAGVAAARHDFVCLLDSDDVYVGTKLTRVAAHLQRVGRGDGGTFLCHDLAIEHGVAGTRLATTWLRVVGVGDEPVRTVDAPVLAFPFAVPAGIVVSRALAAMFFEALPAWHFTRGTDGVLCHAALLACGRVHYLHEPLAVYRMHGGNEFADVVEGRFTPRFDARVRVPKTLRFLEQWVDVLPLGAAQRAAASAYLRQLEHLNRMPSASHGLAEPLVSVAVVGTDAAACAASIEAAAQQSYGRVEIVLGDGVEAGPAVASAGRALARYADDAHARDLARLGAAYAACRGDYVVFVRGGDRLDREFVARHLYLQQHAALVGVSCCDVRAVDAGGALVHEAVYAGSGAWKQPLQPIPPLAVPLRDWVGVPMSACLFRRSEWLARLFDPAARAAPAAPGHWLVFQLALHTGGALRIRESLATIRLPDGAAATYGWFGAPAAIDGTLAEVPHDAAARWLQEFYLDHEEAFGRWLPASWHARFEPWLDAQTAVDAT